MPTGYTSPVVDGKITEFKDFALSCARAFGALVEMRDAPMDAPIPDKLTQSTFYTDALAKARDRLGELTSMGAAEAESEAAKWYRQAVKYADEANARDDEERARLDAMAAQVRAWTPPSPDHREMKKFMLEQLDISQNTYRSPPPVKRSGPDWLKAEIADAKRDVERYADERMKEMERHRDRSEWIRALRASL